MPDLDTLFRWWNKFDFWGRVSNQFYFWPQKFLLSQRTLSGETYSRYFELMQAWCKLAFALQRSCKKLTFLQTSKTGKKVTFDKDFLLLGHLGKTIVAVWTTSYKLKSSKSRLRWTWPTGEDSLSFSVLYFVLLCKDGIYLQKQINEHFL